MTCSRKIRFFAIDWICKKETEKRKRIERERHNKRLTDKQKNKREWKSVPQFGWIERKEVTSKAAFKQREQER